MLDVPAPGRITCIFGECTQSINKRIISWNLLLFAISTLNNNTQLWGEMAWQLQMKYTMIAIFVQSSECRRSETPCLRKFYIWKVEANAVKVQIAMEK
ncbi:hypothetical protein BOTCAL_0348g00060 [Botryotinia calthae]|uniref:Uncharacterized protein n=1 Tax=Botryotinia calthae TaxID=38488 RepID=A0A4Y8CVA9_9HELO|nr:hypothetical protein BOTCAL_0348g00060 [Botryotinia calthae]